MVTSANFEKLSSVYAGKKVFLTGHTGFKGSWLLSCLHLLGANIKGFALNPENDDCLYHCINGDSICQSVIADVRDRETVKKEILSFKPDFIFHLAAQPLVRLSYDTPVETFEANVIGTANVLDAVRFLDNACSIVVITTDKVYENKEWIYPYRENDNLGGYDPYSASKACAELVVSSYRSSFFNLRHYRDHKKSIATARAGNVIGGGDWSKDRIIPDIARALLKNEPITVRNPNAIRPWQHVLEPLLGYLMLGAKLSQNAERYSDAYNFGPNAGDTLAVSELVKTAIDVWGGGSFDTPDAGEQPHEAGILKLDISKAINTLLWQPRLNAREAIAWTMAWYKTEDQASKRKLIFDQIANYYNFR